MGRAVRSHVDFAVVILSGPELASFIVNKNVQNLMNPETKAQLKLAQELTSMAKEQGAQDVDDEEKALMEMMNKCLGRDDGWKRFYDLKIRKNSEVKNIGPDEVKKNNNMAVSERQAFRYALSKDYENSVLNLRNAINENKLIGKEYGLCLQKLANYLDEIDSAKAFDAQRSAFENNDSLFCPPALMKRSIKTSDFDSSSIILSWFKQFEDPNGAIASIVGLRNKLSFENGHKVVERALKDLAPLIGAQGIMPEKEWGEGPDVLWIWQNLTLVIEAKSGNAKTLHKSDSEQLLHSMEWFNQKHNTIKQNVIPVILSDAVEADKKVVFSKETRVLTGEKINKLLDDLEKFFRGISFESSGPLFEQPEIVSKLRSTTKLMPEDIVKNYMEKIKTYE